MEKESIEATQMSLGEAATYLGISLSNLYNQVRAGQIPAYRIGVLWKLDKKILDEWIQAQSLKKLPDEGA